MRTDRQTHTQTDTDAPDHNTFRVVYDSRECNKLITTTTTTTTTTIPTADGISADADAKMFASAHLCCDSL